MELGAVSRLAQDTIVRHAAARGLSLAYRRGA